jgi:hypothetical protein
MIKKSKTAKAIAWLILMSAIATAYPASISQATVQQKQTTYRNLSAAYSDIEIVLNGGLLTPKDVNGKIVDPFIVNGTTYLPVRAISEGLGLNVEWDGNNKTVLVDAAENASMPPLPQGTESGKTNKQVSYQQHNAAYCEIEVVINGWKVTPKDATGDVVEPFLISGTTYLPVRAIGELLGLVVTWNGETRTVYLDDPALKQQEWTQENPAPLGTKIFSVYRYNGADVLYTSQILEVLRGQPAYDMLIKQAGDKQPNTEKRLNELMSSKEFILYKVYVELLPTREVPFDTFKLPASEMSGMTYSGDTKKPLHEPEMAGYLPEGIREAARPGKTGYYWEATVIDKGDIKPVHKIAGTINGWIALYKQQI